MSRALALLALLAAAGPAQGAPPGGAAADEKARAWFTDTALVDQDGRQVRFYSDVLAGRVVVVNLLFTRCQGACPLITAKLNQVRQRLGEDFGSKVHFVSLSVDAAHDGPAELKAFAERNRAVDPAWTFLTGKPDDVKVVLRRLGEQGVQPEDHATTLVIGNVRTRHWKKLRPDLPPEAIAMELSSLAGEDVAPRAAAR